MVFGLLFIFLSVYHSGIIVLICMFLCKVDEMSRRLDSLEAAIQAGKGSEEK